MTPNDVIAGGYRMAKLLVRRMIDDLTPDEFRHQPCPGANSAAWVVGHLAATLRRTAERLGATGLPEVPAELAAKLATTKKPAEDQSGLGDPAALVKLFDVCADAVIAAVAKLPAETLAGPPAFTGPFATNYAEGLLFGALHVSMHSGQLSTVRRSLGKPPVV
ncbi:MAG TPA: DinB family protein [Gemmataceae bacterium]|nr:DinB family protein [Gemmataceae bacterium]